MNMIRVVLAEDHHVVRAAVAEFLNKEPDMQVVGQVAEGGLVLLDAVSKWQPDVLVLDAHMPGHRIVETAQILHVRFPDVHILVLSAYDRQEYIEGLLKVGAVGYVLKDDSPDTLPQAVRAAAKGQQWLSPKVAAVLLRNVRHESELDALGLTPREQEILKLMAAGCRNDEIATRLVISQQTVKNHVRNIYGKLGVETRVEAVLYALNHNLV